MRGFLMFLAVILLPPIIVGNFTMVVAGAFTAHSVIREMLGILAALGIGLPMSLVLIWCFWGQPPSAHP